MKKHRFNVAPDASETEMNAMRADMSANGYDSRFPIVIYEGAILDGWHRWLVANEIGDHATRIEFAGDDDAALDFVSRSATRRNLTSAQCAMLAAKLLSFYTDRAKQRMKLSAGQSHREGW